MQRHRLHRRGFELGEIIEAFSEPDSLENWQVGKPVKLEGFIRQIVSQQKAHLHQTEQLVQAVWKEQSIADTLNSPPYAERLQGRFVNFGASFNEGDQQEIETIFFDALEAEQVCAEDLWLKCSWLSFFEEDASVRFRFSFGADLVEDVAADPTRQHHASVLCDLVFPESSLITRNQSLKGLLQKLLQQQDVHFVERIIYLNAPHGGAYLHHDLERGHAGVVYAQLSGRTFWLALPRHELVKAIIDFSQSNTVAKEVKQLVQHGELLGEALDSFAHDKLIQLINEDQRFISYLHQQGHSRVINTGDIILLPQNSPENCCWHSVFCLGKDVGQALSFAIR